MKLQKRRTKSIRTINIITKHHENCEPKDKCVTDILTNTLQLQDRCHGCFNVWRVIVTNVYTQKIERLLSIFTVIKRDLSAKKDATYTEPAEFYATLCRVLSCR